MSTVTALAVKEPGNGQLELPLPAGVVFTSRRLIIPVGTGQYHHIEIGKFLGASGDSLDFWRADWIEQMRRDLGDEGAKTVLHQLKFEAPAFKRSQLILSMPLRDPDLTTEHHFVLAKAKLDDVGRDMWAGLAKKESLSAHELQESIKKGEVTRMAADDGNEPDTGGAGFATIQGVKMQFRLYKRQIGDEWKSWDLATIDFALGELSEAIGFATDLQMRRRELSKSQAPNPKSQRSSKLQAPSAPEDQS